MNKLLLIIILVVPIDSLFSQTIYKIVYGLQYDSPDSLIAINHVKKVSATITIWDDKKNKFIKLEDFEKTYNDKGNLINQNGWFYNINGKSQKYNWEIRYSYKKNRLVRKNWLSINKNRKHSSDKLFLKRYRSKSKHETLTKYQYAVDDKLTLKTSRSVGNSISFMNIDPIGTHKIKSEHKETDSTKYHYDSIGNLKKQILKTFYEDNTHSSITLYQYDAQSRIIEYVRKNGINDSLSNYEIVGFNYNDSINSINASIKTNGNVFFVDETKTPLTETYFFDDNGNMIEFINYNGEYETFKLIKNDKGLLVRKEIFENSKLVGIMNYKYKYHCPQQQIIAHSRISAIKSGK